MTIRNTLKTIQDGTWIETDADMTVILRTWNMHEPRPKDAHFLWRKKQLEDQLNYRDYLREQAK